MQPRPLKSGSKRDTNETPTCACVCTPHRRTPFVRGGGGYNQGSFVYFAKACGGWVFAVKIWVLWHLWQQPIHIFCIIVIQLHIITCSDRCAGISRIISLNLGQTVSARSHVFPGQEESGTLRKQCCILIFFLNHYRRMRIESQIVCKNWIIWRLLYYPINTTSLRYSFVPSPSFIYGAWISGTALFQW